MKRGTPNHPKTVALAEALQVPRWGAVGILESLWQFASAYARRGDVGRHTDAAFARALDWRGAPEHLVEALVGTGWLDRCGCHRLRIHDWPEHADQTLKRTEEIRRYGFLDCYQEVPPLRGAAFAAPEAGPHSTASGLLAADEQAASQPTPTPTPTPTDTPSPRDALFHSFSAGRTNGNGARTDGSGGKAVEEQAWETEGTEARPTATIESRRREAVEYGTRLGWRPSRRDRRRVWDALASGIPVERIKGSIAELVREQLIAEGRLGQVDPWPPPGMSPYDAHGPPLEGEARGVVRTSAADQEGARDGRGS